MLERLSIETTLANTNKITVSSYPISLTRNRTNIRLRGTVDQPDITQSDRARYGPDTPPTAPNLTTTTNSTSPRQTTDSFQITSHNKYRPAAMTTNPTDRNLKLQRTNPLILPVSPQTRADPRSKNTVPGPTCSTRPGVVHLRRTTRKVNKTHSAALQNPDTITPNRKSETPPPDPPQTTTRAVLLHPDTRKYTVPMRTPDGPLHTPRMWCSSTTILSS